MNKRRTLITSIWLHRMRDSRWSVSRHIPIFRFPFEYIDSECLEPLLPRTSHHTLFFFPRLNRLHIRNHDNLESQCRNPREWIKWAIWRWMIEKLIKINSKSPHSSRTEFPLSRVLYMVLRGLLLCSYLWIIYSIKSFDFFDVVCLEFFSFCCPCSIWKLNLLIFHDREHIFNMKIYDVSLDVSFKLLNESNFFKLCDELCIHKGKS